MWVIVPLGALLVVALVGVAYALGHPHSQEPPHAAAPSVTQGTSTAATTAGPVTPTPAASAATAPTSAAPTVDAPSAAPTPTPRPTATPKHAPLARAAVTIATSSWLDGAASVSGYAAVIEDGGTCTLTLTHAGVTVTGSRAAAADATTTTCGLITVRDPRLTAGAWRAVLTYTSPTSTGASAPTTITIG